MSDFELSFATVIGLEGGYSNDPDDPGGETNWGISKREHPNLNIKNLTVWDAKNIYRTEYWNTMKLDQIVDKDIATELFEQGVNTGPSTAVAHAQLSIGWVDEPIKIDSDIGPVTLGAINKLGQRRKTPFLKCMNGYQFIWYLGIIANKPTQKKYFAGWLSRISFNG